MSLVTRQNSFNQDSTSDASPESQSSQQASTALINVTKSSSTEDARVVTNSDSSRTIIRTDYQISSSSSTNSSFSREQFDTVTLLDVGSCVEGKSDVVTVTQSSSMSSPQIQELEKLVSRASKESITTENLLHFESKELKLPETKVDERTNISLLLDGELKKRDKMIEDLLLMHPLPPFPVQAIESRIMSTLNTSPTSSDELRSELAALKVKMDQQSEDLRETRTSLFKREGRLQELSRQLDAHRQEHARQASTIVSLRHRLQDECDATSRLRGQQTRTELTLAALTRENKQNNDRIVELESRLRTHLEEREIAEQKSEGSQKKLASFVQGANIALNLDENLEVGNGNEKLISIIRETVQGIGVKPWYELTAPADLLSSGQFKHQPHITSLTVRERNHLREEVARLNEANTNLEEMVEHARQSVGRLAKELDEQKMIFEEQKRYMDDTHKDNDNLRSQVRTMEEDIKSIRERLHGTNKSYNETLEELHNAEKWAQQTKDEGMISEHRRLQSEAGWRGFLSTLAALLSTPTDKVHADTETLTEKVQIVAASAKENQEQVERLTIQLESMEEQNKRQSELYNSALKRARQADSDAQTASLRARQLESDIQAMENSREILLTEREKATLILQKVVDALGLKELGDEVTKDVELVVCRAQQLAKLEGEKIVDKTTTVYQLQRRLKSLREAVERKDLHVDMLRRKLAMVEEASRTSSVLTEEKDEALSRCRRQSRTIDRLTVELSESHQQNRDLREQIADNCDDKSKLKHVNTKIEDLTAKVSELEITKSKQLKKINQLKEQIKAIGEHSVEDRKMFDTSLDGITQELANTKQALRDTSRREKQSAEFRRAVIELITGSPLEEEFDPSTDMELLSRLERIISTHRELNDLSRRLDDLTSPPRPLSARAFASHVHSHVHPLSPIRPASAVPMLHSHRKSSVHSDYSMNDIPSEELHSFMDSAQNQRPTARKSRPSSSRSRTPSPNKTQNSTDEEDLES